MKKNIFLLSTYIIISLVLVSCKSNDTGTAGVNGNENMAKATSDANNVTTKSNDTEITKELKTSTVTSNESEAKTTSDVTNTTTPTVSGNENTAKDTSDVNKTTTKSDIQNIKSDAFAPITVKKGIPVRWTIEMSEENIGGCSNAMIIPQYGIEKELSVGETVLEFTPTETGTVPYSCWMGMISSEIKVVD